MFDVIDYLVTTFTALPALAGPAVVFDGHPGPNMPDLLLSVGGTVDPTVDATDVWATIGARQKEEDYRVRCYISSWAGGNSNADQKAARNSAKTVYYAVDAAIRNDITLGSHVRTAEIDSVSIQQTDASDLGCRTDIHFAVHCAVRI